MGSKSCECGHTAANYAANYFVPARVKTRIFTATRKKKRRLSYLCSGFLRDEFPVLEGRASSSSTRQSAALFAAPEYSFALSPREFFRANHFFLSNCRDMQSPQRHARNDVMSHDGPPRKLHQAAAPWPGWPVSISQGHLVRNPARILAASRSTPHFSVRAPLNHLRYHRNQEGKGKKKLQE
jgi:hypothetical protein